MATVPFQFLVDIAPIWSATRSGSTVTVTTGFNYALPQMVSCDRTLGTSQVTVTTVVNHGLTTGDTVTISGVDLSYMNGTYSVTVLSATEYRYTVASSTSNLNGDVSDAVHYRRVISPHGLLQYSAIEVGGLTGAGTAFNGTFQVASVIDATSFTYTTSTSGSGTATVTSAYLSVDLLNPLVNYATADKPNAPFIFTESLSMSASGDGGSSSMSATVVQDVTPSAVPFWSLIPDQARVRLIKKDTYAAPSSDLSDVYFLGFVSGMSVSKTAGGFGSIAELVIDDANSALDKLIVTNRVANQPKAVTPAFGTRISRISSSPINTVRITCSTPHGYTAGQTKIDIMGLLNPGTTGVTGTFNGVGITVYALEFGRETTTFRYQSVGTPGISAADRRIGGITFARVGTTLDQFKVTFTEKHGIIPGCSLEVGGIVSSGMGALNGIYDPSRITVTSDKILTFKALAPIPAADWGAFGNAWLGSVVSITPTGGADQTIVKLPPNMSETDAVKKMLSAVHSFKELDYPMQRIINTSDTSKIVGGTTKNKIGVDVPASSLKSALDTVIEAYQGQDKAERRYFVGLDAKLNFAKVDNTAKPTFATAPYSISTTGPWNTSGTATKSTVYPADIRLDYDINTTKSALLNINGLNNKVISAIRTYTDGDIGFSKRGGTPEFDEIVDYPTTSNNPASEIQRAATSFLAERHLPMLSGTFTLRGAGSIAGVNDYGFSAGYRQLTAAPTYGLVKRWEPGQWVEIYAPEIGISPATLFRVESVNWRLSVGGSFMQEIEIVFNRRYPSTLTSAVGRAKG